jgi:putative endonuclease
MTQYPANSPWHVYLLECADGTLYCGITRDMGRRLAQHNGELPGGARYTAGRRPARLLASRECPHKGVALRLEMAIKSCPRSKKLDSLRQGPVC